MAKFKVGDIVRSKARGWTHLDKDCDLVGGSVYSSTATSPSPPVAQKALDWPTQDPAPAASDVCPQCGTQMIMARATDHGEEYPYCRACKKELKEMQTSVEIHLGEFKDASTGHIPLTLEQMQTGLNLVSKLDGSTWTVNYVDRKHRHIQFRSAGGLCWDVDAEVLDMMFTAQVGSP
jgi:hypothetical protein